MPILLLREESSTSLSTLVEKAQKRIPPLPEYDLQLNNGHLHLILLTKTDRKVNPTATDEGFESDIDSLSIVSSDNDSFTIEKLSVSASKTTETDSANGSSSSDSDTEIVDTKDQETHSTVQSQSALEKPGIDIKSDSSIIVKKSIESFKSNPSLEKPKESYNLVDCICYTDVKCTDILIFVIKKEAFVFKFENIAYLQTFYTNFTTLKAVANQKNYNKNFSTKFNLLQRTDNNGVTHIQITRETEPRPLKKDGPSSIISINTPGDILDKFSKHYDNRLKEINSRQRTESKFLNDIKYNTISSKLGPKAKIITRSNSIENILDLDQYKSNLVNPEKHTNLRKIWNSAEDLLEPPKRPDRRRKPKGKAPQPPTLAQETQEDIYSGQYVRVNVNFDPVKELEKNRLVVKSSLNEPHPKKLQNFNILSTKPSLTSFLKPKEKQVLKYEPKKIEPSGTIGRNRNVMDSTWTNSVPRLLKKPRSKSETRNFVPMAYRYIDTTQDYPVSYNTNTIQRNANFERNNMPVNYYFPQNVPSTYHHNLAMSNYLRGENSSHNISNRLFGLSPKLREFSNPEETRIENRWGSVSEINMCVSKDNNLKSVIKNNKEDASKKKNEKKVTFSAYTTVQVV